MDGFEYGVETWIQKYLEELKTQTVNATVMLRSGTTFQNLQAGVDVKCFVYAVVEMRKS